MKGISLLITIELRSVTLGIRYGEVERIETTITSTSIAFIKQQVTSGARYV